MIVLPNSSFTLVCRSFRGQKLLKNELRSNFQSASEKVFDRDSLYKKILESYRASKKHGLSESLAKKLKRRRMRKLRKHTKRHHSEFSNSFQSKRKECK